MLSERQEHSAGISEGGSRRHHPGGGSGGTAQGQWGFHGGMRHQGSSYSLEMPAAWAHSDGSP